jgi:hypothetical protein
MTAFVIVLFGMIGLYYVLNLIMHSLPEVEAGATSGINGTGSQRVSGNIAASYWKKEADGSSSLHRNFIVKGKCMEPVKINEGSVQSVRIFNKHEKANLANILKANDIVLIHLNDKKFRGYKLRIVNHVSDSNANTYYFVNGIKQESSKPHSLDSIIGIIG